MEALTKPEQVIYTLRISLVYVTQYESGGFNVNIRFIEYKQMKIFKEVIRLAKKNKIEGSVKMEQLSMILECN